MKTIIKEIKSIHGPWYPSVFTREIRASDGGWKIGNSGYITKEIQEYETKLAKK